jgi:hypothetical protein
MYVADYIRKSVADCFQKVGGWLWSMWLTFFQSGWRFYKADDFIFQCGWHFSSGWRLFQSGWQFSSGWLTLFERGWLLLKWLTFFQSGWLFSVWLTFIRGVADISRAADVFSKWLAFFEWLTSFENGGWLTLFERGWLLLKMVADYDTRHWRQTNNVEISIVFYCIVLYLSIYCIIIIYSAFPKLFLPYLLY